MTYPQTQKLQYRTQKKTIAKCTANVTSRPSATKIEITAKYTAYTRQILTSGPLWTNIAAVSYTEKYYNMHRQNLTHQDLHSAMAKIKSRSLNLKTSPYKQFAIMYQKSTSME
jgi:hypothetical protein